MLVNLAELFKDAKKGNYAVGAFNTPTFEAVRAVIAAAEEMNCPVILDHAEGHEWFTKIEDIGPVMLDYARKAKVPVCCHLDHGVSPSMLWRAVRVGFPSVMYDCSAMPYEENIANVKEFVTFAHKMGMTVEAELGKMPNKEAGTLDADGNVVDYKPEDLYTDPLLKLPASVRRHSVTLWRFLLARFMAFIGQNRSWTPMLLQRSKRLFLRMLVLSCMVAPALAPKASNRLLVTELERSIIILIWQQHRLLILLTILKMQMIWSASRSFPILVLNICKKMPWKQ